MYVKVQYYRGNGIYAGGLYTYGTFLNLEAGDKVIAPTVNEPRQRAIVKETGVPMPKFPCREISEYDPDGEIAYAD